MGCSQFSSLSLPPPPPFSSPSLASLPLPFHSSVPYLSPTFSPASLPSFSVPFPLLSLEVSPLKPARGSGRNRIWCTIELQSCQQSLATGSNHFDYSKYMFYSRSITIQHQTSIEGCFDTTSSPAYAPGNQGYDQGQTQSCTILALFRENNENEHLIFREFHGR